MGVVPEVAQVAYKPRACGRQAPAGVSGLLAVRSRSRLRISPHPNPPLLAPASSSSSSSFTLTPDGPVAAAGAGTAMLSAPLSARTGVTTFPKKLKPSCRDSRGPCLTARPQSPPTPSIASSSRLPTLAPQLAAGAAVAAVECATCTGGFVGTAPAALAAPPLLRGAVCHAAGAAPTRPRPSAQMLSARRWRDGLVPPAVAAGSRPCACSACPCMSVCACKARQRGLLFKVWGSRGRRRLPA